MTLPPSTRAAEMQVLEFVRSQLNAAVISDCLDAVGLRRQCLATGIVPMTPGGVFVTPTGRATDIAVWGELLSTAAQRRGAAGAVTDGLVRDIRGIRKLGFPVWSTGRIPYDSMGRHEVVAHRVPAVIDGVVIEPRDLIVADDDGVVVVPQALTGQIVEAAAQKRASERAFRTAVSDGIGATEAFRRFGVL